MERERDLVAALRAELAAVRPARPCCRRAERAGLGAAATGRAPDPGVARLAVRLLGGGSGPGGAGRAGGGGTDGFDWAAAAEHCRLAWLRGRFLAAGSLSLTPSRTHLEFVVAADEAAGLAVRLGELRLPASWRIRRGRGVVTWKSRETVLTFLRRAGATAAALELESRSVTRALRGQLNRVLNAEGANVERSVAAARRQLAAMETLEAAGELERFPAFDRAVARLRREEPGQTLGDLAEHLGVSRPRVQRALRRLEAAAHRSRPVGVG